MDIQTHGWTDERIILSVSVLIVKIVKIGKVTILQYIIMYLNYIIMYLNYVIMYLNYIIIINLIKYYQTILKFITPNNKIMQLAGIFPLHTYFLLINCSVKKTQQFVNIFDCTNTNSSTLTTYKAMQLYHPYLD